ncbi:MAG TPA: DUF222 domain-containing protein [Trebonia sp.]
MTGPRNGGQNGPDGGGRDGRLGWFAMGGQYDRAVPTGQMIAALEDVTGEGSRPPVAATLDEVTGMLTSWAAAEAHACAGKLAAIREIIRREADGEPDGTSAHDLPRQWDIGVAHEVAAALGMSWQAAEPLIGLAYDMEGRLPRAGKLLDQGILNWQKAKIAADEFAALGDQIVYKAEKMLLDRILTGDGRLRDDMTPARLRRLCQQIVIELDPDGAAKRREAAEHDSARVEFFKSHGGAGALFADGLPADEALMGEANIQKRAEEYRSAGIYPDGDMDLLRVLALVDSLNGRSFDDRVNMWKTAAAEALADAARLRESAQDNGPDDGEQPGDGPDDGPGGDGNGDDGNGDGNGEPGPGDPVAPAGKPDPGLPSLVHLTLPLATLEGIANRPGEAIRYGALDPALVRRLGEAAAASLRSRFCLTITGPDGHAAYHGCARHIRGTGNENTHGSGGAGNRDGPSPEAWDLVPDRSRAGPDRGSGAWILTVPGGRRYRIDLYKVPVTECDHRYETHAYRPGNLLRHLVQVRDGECTSVSCSMPAWRCDFEHAIPYEKGGKTDACNAGARSRRCHQVKQSRGWKVTQPRPGWHQWRAPSGRTYTKRPMEYPA